MASATAGFRAVTVPGPEVMAVETDPRVVDNSEQRRYELWLGGRLVAGALDDLRTRGLKLVPLCPFVRTYLRRHSDYAHLVVGDRAAPQRPLLAQLVSLTAMMLMVAAVRA